MWLILFCMCNILMASNEEAAKLVEQAKQFKTEKKLNAANVHLEKAALIYEAEKDYNNWVNCYYQIGRNTRKKNPQLALNYLQQAKATAILKLGEQHEWVGRICNYIGYIHFLEENFDKAEKSLQQSIDIFEKNGENNDKNLATAYRRLGGVYRRQAAYEKTINYYKKAAKLYEQLENWNRVASMKISIAQIYEDKKKHKEATEIYKEVLQYPNLPFIYKLAVEQSLIEILCKEEKYEEALTKAQNLLKLGRQEFSSDANKEISSIHESIADVCLLMSKFDKAETHLQKALKINKNAEVFDGKGRETAETYRSLGKVFAKQGKEDKALKAYQKSLVTLLPNFNDSLNVTVNPTKKMLRNDPKAMELLAGKADVFIQKYEKLKDIKYLKSALETYNLSITQLNLLKQSFRTEDDQVWITGNEYIVYEKAIQTAIKLWENTQENTYAEQAFYLVEDSKASVLLAVSQEAAAQQLAAIPDSIKKEIKTYKTAITDLQTQVFQTKETKLQQTYKDSLFEVERKLEKKIEAVEKEYPNYKDVKFTKNIVTLSQIQEHLKISKEGLVEYFIGDKQIYIFTITAQQIQLKAIEKDSKFVENIHTLRALLNNQLKDDKKYFEMAYELYNTLLKPFIDNETINKNTLEKLIIIPDGILAYIPFEALITEKSTCEKNCYHINKANYLIEKYTINYAYSASLLLEQTEQKNQASLSYLGFAPFAGTAKNSTNLQATTRGCSNELLQTLSASKIEVDSIHELLGGQIFQRETATKQKFIEEASKYKIVHLSTHACIDDTDPAFNRIYFADEPLLNYELYNMELNAELAVLSACNTASGILKKGEGIMSLARAFTYAGCPSIITSLWSVPDVETSKVIIHFYKELAKGKPKDEALRNAKLKYLNQSNITSAESLPYFWAAFVPIGDMQALTSKSGDKKGKHKKWFLTIPILLIGLVILRRKR